MYLICLGNDLNYNILCIWTSQRMESGKTDSVKCNMGLKWGMQFVLVAVGTSFVLLDPSNNVHLGIHQSWQLSPHLLEWELICIRWQLKNKHCNKWRAKCILGHISAIYLSLSYTDGSPSHASSSSSPLAYRRGEGLKPSPPPKKNSESPPKSCQTHPNCEKC